LSAACAGRPIILAEDERQRIVKCQRRPSCCP
jgi:hypothetical protein